MSETATKKKEKTSAGETKAEKVGAKDEGGGKSDTGDASSDPSLGYSRGEGQKPVSDRYRKNWDAVFRRKKG